MSYYNKRFIVRGSIILTSLGHLLIILKNRLTKQNCSYKNFMNYIYIIIFF